MRAGHAVPGHGALGATTNRPTALPGTYLARLTVDGRSFAQPFIVKKHPFFAVSYADLREQFELACRIRKIVFLCGLCGLCVARRGQVRLKPDTTGGEMYLPRFNQLAQRLGIDPISEK